MERDDIIEYSLDSHHDEETGKKIRKKIVFVTVLLTVITAFEVGLGIIAADFAGFHWEMVKWTFIVLTLIKAAYIVLSFMHLGEERKSLRYVILAPYALFLIYLMFILFSEASVLFGIRQLLEL